MASGARAGKLDKKLKLAGVGVSQRVEVPVPGRAHRLQVTATPTECLAAQVLHKPVSAEPGMAAVAVREGMNAHELMMEVDSQEVSLARLMDDTFGEIEADLPDHHRDLLPRTPDVLIVPTIGACPLPGGPEHLLVDPPQSRVRKQSAAHQPAAGRPFAGPQYVLLLGAVKGFVSPNAQKQAMRLVLVNWGLARHPDQSQIRLEPCAISRSRIVDASVSCAAPSVDWASRAIAWLTSPTIRWAARFAWLWTMVSRDARGTSA